MLGAVWYAFCIWAAFGFAILAVALLATRQMGCL